MAHCHEGRPAASLVPVVIFACFFVCRDEKRRLTANLSAEAAVRGERTGALHHAPAPALAVVAVTDPEDTIAAMTAVMTAAMTGGTTGVMTGGTIGVMIVVIGT